MFDVTATGPSAPAIPDDDPARHLWGVDPDAPDMQHVGVHLAAMGNPLTSRPPPAPPDLEVQALGKRLDTFAQVTLQHRAQLLTPS